MIRFRLSSNASLAGRSCFIPLLGRDVRPSGIPSMTVTPRRYRNPAEVTDQLLVSTKVSERACAQYKDEYRLQPSRTGERNADCLKIRLYIAKP